jgi:hypothetical protein
VKLVVVTLIVLGLLALLASTALAQDIAASWSVIFGA